MTTAITDFSGFSELRSGAQRNDPEALREVAGQFEAIFVQMMLKNMRNSALADTVFGESNQFGLYQEMLDQQFALEMSNGNGIGLADMLVRQLGGGGELGETPRHQSHVPAWSDPAEFVKDVWAHAERAGKQLNVDPQALLAQAALETGWGRRVMQHADGTSSNNLFGIKAGGSWTGDSVSKFTLEYSDGTPSRHYADFRSYPDLHTAFDDYVRLLQDSQRYASALDTEGDSGAFGRALATAGYATDPAYARKIAAVLNSETMRAAVTKLKFIAPTPITSVRTPRID